ncbi:MAG: cellulase family glycosylhydrolase [Sedimentisphaerales bacterium]|nr:cellulase family glycosylhydrolase [Sedimentisphaerales bacterium]
MVRNTFNTLLVTWLLLAIGTAASANSLPQLTIPNNFGANIHFTANPRFEEMRLALEHSSFFESGSYLTDYNNDLDLISQGGLGFIRMDMCWGLIESKRGVYDFENTGYDGLTKGCLKRGIRIIYILDYSNKLYESERSVRTLNGRKAYAAFAKAAVSRYKGKPILWEIWNEPNVDFFWKPQPNAAEYCRLVEIAAASIKQVDPSAIVVAPAVSGIKLQWLEECFKKGLLKWIDALTVHPYRSQNKPPESVIDEYSKLRQLIRKYTPNGKDIPVLSGEWGYSLVNRDGTRFSEKRQAQYVVRMFLVNLYQQVPVSIWYDWRDDGTDANEREYNFGITRHNLEPKMAYIAVKTLTNTLEGYSIKKRLDLASENDFALVLSKNGEQALAFWTIEQPHEIEIPLGPGEAKLVKMLGSQINLSWQSKQINVFVSESPQYLLLKSVPKHQP